MTDLFNKEFVFPRHVAFIMDGNGRWAQKRNMPRSFGHKAGVDAMRRVIRYCGDLGIEAVSFYAFSTENWKRNQNEINFLMKLPIDFVEQDLPELMEKKAKLIYSGDLSKIPQATLDAMNKGHKATSLNDGLKINIAFNYGGRDEIIRAVQKILASGIDKPSEFTEELLSRNLDQPFLPEPDLIVRTGGEQRLSNFFLWQGAYSEFYFCSEYWPDMDDVILGQIFDDYKNRKRRFGGY